MPRTKLELDENLIADYAESGASTRDIAAMLMVDEGTIRKRFKLLILQRRAKRRIALHKLQNAAAKSGEVAMLIFLGKNELGQSNEPQMSAGKPLPDVPTSEG